jgi:hypothetical protein
MVVDDEHSTHSNSPMTRGNSHDASADPQLLFHGDPSMNGGTSHRALALRGRETTVRNSRFQHSVLMPDALDSA